MSPVVCLVTDRRRSGADWMAGVVAQVSAGAGAGLHLVQVRERDLDAVHLGELVRRCLDAVRGTRTRIVVNERLDVALATGAHGVHLRADSLPASRVRALCPRPFLIGRSVHAADDARRADPADLDYLLFGTVFVTPSKPGRVPAGLDRLREAVQATRVPVLALGGVTTGSLPSILATGAAGCAGIGLFEGDTAATVRRLLQSDRIDTASEQSLT